MHQLLPSPSIELNLSYLKTIRRGFGQEQVQVLVSRLLLFFLSLSLSSSGGAILFTHSVPGTTATAATTAEV